MQDPLVLTAAELDGLIGKFLRRYSFVDHRNIQVFAERLAHHLGMTAVPRNPFTLLPEHLGIKLHRQLLPRGKRAQWMRQDNIYLIEYNDHMGHDQLALGLWHEFFEIIACHPWFPSRLGSDLECELAWQFADHMTMPERVFKSICKEVGHPEEDKADVLANRFGVSLAGARKRLKGLGLEHHDKAR